MRIQILQVEVKEIITIAGESIPSNAEIMKMPCRTLMLRERKRSSIIMITAAV